MTSLNDSTTHEIAQTGKEAGALVVKVTILPAFTVHEKETDTADSYEINS